MESLFHLTFFKPVSTTHINGAEISIIMNPGLEIANEEVSAVCPVEEERVENLKMIEVNIPTPVTVEVEELERAGGNVNENCGIAKPFLDVIQLLKTTKTYNLPQRKMQQK